MHLREYLSFDGVGLAALIKSGEVGVREVAEAAIRQIEAVNPHLNAVVMKNYDNALAAVARSADSPLCGVPFLLKDVNLYCRDMPTTFASRYFQGAKSRPDSTMVQRWRQAGLVFLGKSNTPEFAGEFTTEPIAFGATRNPWNTALTVGGSSGGAAAAVASGMVPLAHGTDLAGSIRVPAACCGVFGFKPTAHLNPVSPYFEEIAHGLNSDHVISRTVRDSAASIDITSNKPASDEPFLGSLENRFERMRIGLTFVDESGKPSGSDQQTAVELAAEILRDLGHEIVPYVFPTLDVGAWYDLLWMSDIPGLLESRALETGRPPDPDELEDLTQAALKMLIAAGPDGVASARLKKRATAQAILHSVRDVDILLTPALAGKPAAIGLFSFHHFGTYESWIDAFYEFAPYTVYANIAGQPSASCPIVMAKDGLPVSIQISGKPGSDRSVLQLSRELERAVGWTQFVPALRSV